MRTEAVFTLDKSLAEIKRNGRKVLVTGGSGYIGAEFVRRLLRHGIDHISIDSRNSAGSNSIALDLRDKIRTAAAIEEFEPDALVHCGTHSALAYRDNFLQSFNQDVEALTNILEPLAKRPTCRLIYFSSSYVYSGQTSDAPTSELVTLQPVHNFGVAKVFFEQLALRTHPSTLVFRLASVFGPGKALNPNAIVSMAKECLETGQLTVWGTGSRKMQYVLMQDVLTYLCQAFALPPGINNLGGSEYPSVAESAEAIAEFFGAQVVFLPDKKEGDTLPFMDTTKLRQSTGDYFTPFKDSLNEYLGFLRRDHSPASSNQLRSDETGRR